MPMPSRRISTWYRCTSGAVRCQCEPRDVQTRGPGPAARDAAKIKAEEAAGWLGLDSVPSSAAAHQPPDDCQNDKHRPRVSTAQPKQASEESDQRGDQQIGHFRPRSPMPRHQPPRLPRMTAPWRRSRQGSGCARDRLHRGWLGLACSKVHPHRLAAHAETLGLLLWF
jgi:hypothetical protein